MALPARTARLTDAVFRSFGETATLRPAAGGDPVEDVRVILRRPTDTSPLWEGETVTANPFVRIPHADVTRLRKNDVVDGVDGRAWKIKDAPRRPGDGRVWVAEVIDHGAET